MNALTKHRAFDIGEISPPGERLQVSLATDAHALKRIVTTGKIAPQREQIEDARDALTDILQWMDKDDGTRNSRRYSGRTYEAISSAKKWSLGIVVRRYWQRLHSF